MVRIVQVCSWENTKKLVGVELTNGMSVEELKSVARKRLKLKCSKKFMFLYSSLGEIVSDIESLRDKEVLYLQEMPSAASSSSTTTTPSATPRHSLPPPGTHAAANTIVACGAEGVVPVRMQTESGFVERKIKYTPHTVVKELIDSFTSKTPVDNIEDYSLDAIGPFMKLRLDPNRPLVSYHLQRIQYLLFSRTQIRLRLKTNGSEFRLVSSPEATIQDLYHEVKLLEEKKRICILRPDSVFYLRSGRGGGYGLILEEHRTLGSYRINTDSFLEIRTDATNRKSVRMNRMVDKTMLFVVIDSPAQNLTTTCCCSMETKVFDLVSQFLSRHPIPDPDDHCLYYGDTPMTDLLAKLANFNLKNPALLHFKRSPHVSSGGTHARRSVASPALARKSFKALAVPPLGALGGSPASSPLASPHRSVFDAHMMELDFVEECGFRVPSILAQLKACLVEMGGLHKEGIFSVPGAEPAMKTIQTALNLGQRVRSPSPYEPATLILRWLVNLTEVHGALSMLTDDRLTELTTLPPAKMVQEKLQLPAIQLDIFLWLMDLGVEIAFNQEKTLMGPRNLAVCLAPALLGIQTSSTATYLARCDAAQRYVQLFLEGLMEAAETALKEDMESDMLLDEVIMGQLESSGMARPDVPSAPSSELDTERGVTDSEADGDGGARLEDAPGSSSSSSNTKGSFDPCLRHVDSDSMEEFEPVFEEKADLEELLMSAIPWTPPPQADVASPSTRIYFDLSDDEGDAPSKLPPARPPPDAPHAASPKPAPRPPVPTRQQRRPLTPSEERDTRRGKSTSPPREWSECRTPNLEPDEATSAMPNRRLMFNRSGSVGAQMLSHEPARRKDGPKVETIRVRRAGTGGTPGNAGNTASAGSPNLRQSSTPALYSQVRGGLRPTTHSQLKAPSSQEVVLEFVDVRRSPEGHSVSELLALYEHLCAVNSMNACYSKPPLG